MQRYLGGQKKKGGYRNTTFEVSAVRKSCMLKLHRYSCVLVSSQIVPSGTQVKFYDLSLVYSFGGFTVFVQRGV